MNGIGFQMAAPHVGTGGKMARIIELPIAGGYAEAQGALILAVAGAFQACGADPASIGAVSLTPGGADTSGFNELGRKEFPPLTMQGICLEDQLFLAPYIGTPGAVNALFGVIRDSDGVWKVDFNETVNTRLVFLGFPDKSPADAAGAGQDSLALVRFLAANIQLL